MLSHWAHASLAAVGKSLLKHETQVKVGKVYEQLRQFSICVSQGEQESLSTVGNTIPELQESHRV